MTLLEIALVGAALVVDAVAVAAATAIAARRVRVADALRMGTLFGLFHVAMPGLGWALGAGVGPLVQAWDHWIAAGLLGFVAAGMIRGVVRSEGADQPATAEDGPGPFALRALLPLAIATSIDALAVGVSLPMMGAPLLPSLATFGIFAFVVSAGAALLVRRAGRALGPTSQRIMTAVGALVLLGIGARILIEHIRQGI